MTLSPTKRPRRIDLISCDESSQSKGFISTNHKHYFHNVNESRACKLPVVIDFHGGGFVLGSYLEQTPFCAKLARELNCVLVTVDYRMGPASKHSAALEDAEDVLSAFIDAKTPGYLELRNAVAKD